MPGQTSDRRSIPLAQRNTCLGPPCEPRSNHDPVEVYSQESSLEIWTIQTQEFGKDNNQHSLGALLSRGTASQGTIHSGRISSVFKELDTSPVGQLPAGGSEDSRSGTLAAGNNSGGWDQGQDQMC